MWNRGVLKDRFAPFLLLLTCLSLTTVGFVFLSRMTHEKASLKFESEWRDIKARIQTHVNMYTEQLYANRALFAASKSVERNEWASFINNQRLSSQFPGIVASEFIESVSSDALGDFIRSVKEDKSIDPEGYPTFDVFPKHQTKNHYIVTYVEPFTSNRKVFGYNMSSDGMRSEVLQRAAETGKAVATSKIHLIQDPSHAGLIIALPIYKNKLPVTNKTERLTALQGFVASVIDTSAFFRHDFILSTATNQIGFEIFDSALTTKDHLLFNFDHSLNSTNQHDKAKFSVNTPMVIGNRTFILNFTASQNFRLGEGQEWFPYWILGIGILTSFLFFTLLQVLASRESKALQYADEKTEEIKLLLEASTDGIYGINLEGRFTFMNSAALQLLGYALEEVIGKNIHHLAHLKKLDGAPYPIEDCPIYQAFQSGISCRVDTEVLWHKDGTSFPVEYSASPMIRRGKILGSLCTFSDITERKIAEEKLARAAAEAEILHQAATFATRDLTFDVALKETLALVCQGIHWPVGHVCKLSPDHKGLESTDIWYLNDPEKYHPFKKLTESLYFPIGTGLPGRIAQSRDIAWIDNVQNDHNFPRKQVCAEVGITSAFAFPITIEGRVVAVLEFFIPKALKPDADILKLVGNLSKQLQVVFEKKRAAEAAEAVEASRLRLQAVLDSATEVSIITTDTQGLITVFNKGAEKMLGWKAEEMLYQKTPEVIHTFEEVSERGKEMSLTSGKTVEGFEVFVANARAGKPQLREWTYVKKDGTRFPVSLYITGVYNASHELSGFLGIATDITKIKQAEIQLQEAARQAYEASRIKSDFLATMSHEIRTPMNAILGMSDLLTETPLTAEQKDYLARLSRAGETLLSIINDVLDLSKIEARSMEIEHIAFNLKEQVGKTVDLLASKAHQKGLAIHWQLDPEIPAILQSDPTRLWQILLNLINNAIKFTEEGEISLSVKPVKKEIEHKEKNEIWLHFALSDTGIGIPRDKINKLFKPFAQADSSTTRKFGGTGLGLNICKRLVELMGGKIWAESEEGKGSCFHFILPFGKSDTLQEKALETASEDSPLASSLKILLADDSEDNQSLIQAYLKKYPYQIDIAENGKIACDKSAATEYDVILMDMQMPEMDGYTASRIIREREAIGGPKRHVPIIALTANALIQDAQRCLAAGCDQHLSKPIKKSILLQTLQSISIKRLLERRGLK